MDENTLHFKITVDGNGLKEFQSEASKAFKGVGQAVNELSEKSVSDLQDISLEVMEVVDRFNQLATSVGISPKELRETLNYLREMKLAQDKLDHAARERVERLANAEAKLIRQQLANLDAERRAKEKNDKAELATQTQLASIKIQNIRTVGKLRDDEYSKFIGQINSENKKIKEQGDKAVEAFEKVLNSKKKFSSSFTDGAKNVFSGSNNGTFSNILGGFGGGGRFGGTVASALDGAMAGGGGGAAMIGGLAAGASIGLAIAGIQTFISLIKSATSLLYDWGKAGIQSAADFEATVNSIAVFSGGINSARRELSLLEETVENTTGLSLEGAEAGYKQLRALGFEADNSRKLIEGLGKIRITSGATEQSVERVIVNLTQLSSSTARAGQDIKEIIHALPAMRQIFRETFGTSEATKLKSLIEKDGDAFFAKLGEGMEKAKVASGGMNSELVKLENQWTLVWREFGKPVVPVLTEGFKELTVWLKANKNEFREWGIFVADAIKGAIALIPSLVTGLGYVARVLAAAGTFGLSEGAIGAYQLSQTREYQKVGTKSSGIVDSSISDINAVIEEARQKQEDAITKAEIAEEKSRERQLKALQESVKLRSQITENSYKIEEERISSLMTYTVSQEAAKAAMLSTIRRQSLIAQRDGQISSIDEEIKLQKGNEDEIRQLMVKKAETIERFNTDIAINEIKRIKEAADFERKQLEQRRQTEIEFKGIQLESVKSAYEQITTEVNRGLQKQIIGTDAAYSTLRSATNRYYDDVIRISRERNNLQLEDRTLSEEQRRNLQEKANLEERNILEAQKNALLKIQDDQYAAEDAKREKNLQRLKAYFTSLGEMIQSTVSSFFNPEQFASSNLDSFRKNLLGSDLKAELDAANNEDRNRSKRIEEARRVNGEIANGQRIQTKDDLSYKEIESLVVESAKLLEVSGQLQSKWNEFEKTIQPVYLEIDKLGESLTKSVGNFKDFDKILALSLKERHRLEVESLTSEIENTQRRLDRERQTYINGIQADIARWKKDNEKLDKSIKDGLDVDINTIYRRVNDNLITLNENELSKTNSEDWLPPTDKAIELDGILKQLGIDLSALRLKQHSEDTEQLAASIKGLSERFNDLNSGDVGAVSGVLNAVAKDVLQERIALLEENIELEARIGIVGDDSAARYRNAWLRAIYDVKRASEDARTSQIKSQVEIANQTVFNADVARAGILEAMAGAKGYTEIFQDAFLSVNDKIGEGLSSLIKKATDGLGMFGDILADIASQLLRMVTNRLMMKLLDMLLPATGLGNGGNGGGSGGLNIGNIFQSVLGIGRTTSAGAGANLGIGGVGGSTNVNAIRAAINFATGTANGGGGGFSFGSPFTSVSSITAGETLSGGSNLFSGAPFSTASAGVGGRNPFAVDFGFGGKAISGNSFSFGNLAKGLGAMAPILGLSLGAGLGGSSIGGQLLGGIGGLAGGLALGIGTGAIGTGATAGFSILGGVLSAASATGILAAVAAPLLIGGWLLGRNKQRKADEKTRSQYITDALGQLEDILKKVRSHDMSGSEAISSAEQIRESYRQSASQLKDKKTRNIALKEINDRINPKIEEIRAAATIADEDRKRFEDRIPEFATGGIVPGRFGEPRLVLAHGGEIIANPSQQTPAFLSAAGEAGIPGVRGGSAGSGNANGGNPIHVEFVIGTEAQNQLFVNGAKSNQGYNVTIEQNRKASKFRDA